MDDQELKSKVIVAGANGLLGKELCKSLADSYDVVCLVREVKNHLPGREVHWSGSTEGAWCEELEGAYAVINLAGSPINVRWTVENQALILSSRVQSTEALGRAMAKCEVPPLVWLNGSAVGFYGDRGTEPLTEATVTGEGFLAETCQHWEAAVSPLPQQRVAFLRTGVVLSKQGGALKEFVKLTRKNLGSTIGDGKQVIPWIGIDDWVSLVALALTNHLSGPLNIVAPNPVDQREMMDTLKFVLKKKSLPPVPTPIFRLVSSVIGIPAELGLISQNVVPQKALDAGFKFRFPELETFLRRELS